MNPHSKGYRAGGLATIVCVTCLAAVGQAAATLDGKSNPPRVHGRALRTEKGSYSFRGLNVATGETGAAYDVVIRNSGEAPLAGVHAVTHGDFVITANRCPQLLPAAGSGQNSCVISVAFKPSAPGMRTGDLTVQAKASSHSLSSRQIRAVFRRLRS